MTKSLQDICLREGLSITTAESCSGGNIAHQITKQSGSSGYFYGGVVSYSNQIKETVLGVNKSSLLKNGAVSETVAIEMAVGVRKVMKSNYSVSTTGIAGPTGAVTDKPIGTVWIAVSSNIDTVALCFNFKGNREEVIAQTTQMAIELLQERIESELRA